MKIAHLNKEKALANIDRLIEIDKIILDDPWTVNNFLVDLDCKWEFSLVALENGQIMGFLICSTMGNNLHIHRIAVSPEHQQKKIGSTLIKQLIEDCYKSNIGKITLNVSVSNLDAQRFYEQLGFKKITLHESRYFYEKVIQ